MAYIRKYVVELEVDGTKHLGLSIVGEDFVTVEYGGDEKSRLIGNLTAEVVADQLLGEMVRDKIKSDALYVA
jgi:hypothetical protein